LPVVPRRRALNLSSVTQNQQYASLHATFTSTTGAVNEHLAWHQSHGSGSDDHFLFWHRYYLRWLEDYLGAQGADYTAPVPYWPSNTPIPAELSAGTLDTTPNVTPPSWTTMAARLAQWWQPAGQPVRPRRRRQAAGALLERVVMVVGRHRQGGGGRPGGGGSR
jgi:hypothetical protein